MCERQSLDKSRSSCLKQLKKSSVFNGIITFSIWMNSRAQRSIFHPLLIKPTWTPGKSKRRNYFHKQIRHQPAPDLWHHRFPAFSLTGRRWADLLSRAWISRSASWRTGSSTGSHSTVHLTSFCIHVSRWSGAAALRWNSLSSCFPPVFQTSPLQELQCPRGLQETDFLHLLRSTFPQLAGDKPFDFLKSDRSKELHPLRVKTLTPEEIHRRIGSNTRSILYIQLKVRVFTYSLSLYRVQLPVWSTFIDWTSRIFIFQSFLFHFLYPGSRRSSIQ